jgi:hypothetical protein
MSVAGSRQAAASAGANKRKRTEDGMAAVDSFTRSILMKDLVAMQKNPLPFAWMPDDVLIDDNILTTRMQQGALFTSTHVFGIEQVTIRRRG